LLSLHSNAITTPLANQPDSNGAHNTPAGGHLLVPSAPANQGSHYYGCYGYTPSLATPTDEDDDDEQDARPKGDGHFHSRHTAHSWRDLVIALAVVVVVWHHCIAGAPIRSSDDTFN
jgi:hypothetical protein